jgi:hypothetical protein
VSKLISESPDIHCDLHPSYSCDSAKKCTCALLLTITTIINLFLASGVLLMSSNLVLCTLFLKSLTLIKINCPSTDLSLVLISFLSKLTECVVKSRLITFLTEHNLLHSFQSAYTKLHSTETALLAVHDYLIRANSQQQVYCLYLLNHSTAFDTIYHSILLEHLSS